MKKLALTAVIVCMAAGGASAGSIERACIKSDRKAANRSLCGCIQNVADKTLSSTDQRMAARFFSDPHMAQEIRQSKDRSHEVFWQRYKQFGATAETYCG